MMPHAPDAPKDPPLPAGPVSPPRAGGRWLTRCQYYKIHPSEKMIPFDTAKPLRSTLLGLLKDMDMEGAAIRGALEAQWPRLAGLPLAGQTRPGTIENGALTIFVKSPTWKFELDRHLSGPLLEKLVRELPELRIRRLVTRIDPGRFDRAGETKAAR